MNSRLHQVKDWKALARAANWSASALAKKCNITLRALERYFVQNIGQTPQTWLAAQRQRLATELLSEIGTVKETAFHLGYKHSTHFSRDFKRFSGQSPTVFMNSAKWAAKQVGGTAKSVPGRRDSV